jgi:hypothetical protein
MAEATSSHEGSSRTQVQVSSLPRELHSAEFEGTALPAEDQGEEPKTRAHRASRARHSRKCTVCHHPDREFIDQDYLRWLSPKKIAHEYKISHHSVVYRHADATGLRAQRRASLRATLENFIEQAESVRATAGSVVAAVRLYAQINDQGQWTPPVRRHIVEHRYTSAAEAASASAPVHKKDGVPPSVTTVATSATPPAQAHKKSSAVGSTGSFQPVATITAGSVYPEWPAGLTSKGEVPFGASQDKFPAVPVASINFASDLPISNREHVELEHAATR